MTGERELPEGETEAIGGGDAAEEIGSGGADWERSGGGAKKPTRRTFGSMTERGFRRGSMKREGDEDRDRGVEEERE